MKTTESLRDARFREPCTCDPEAYDSGPEGQRRYFADRYCPIHGEHCEKCGGPIGVGQCPHGPFGAPGMIGG